MNKSTILLVLLAMHLLIWLVSIILSYLVKDKRTKAVELEAVSIHLLYKEVKRLNNRIDSYYHIKDAEKEGPK